MHEAILIPLKDMPKRLDELKKDDTLLVICGTGKRGGSACDTLKSKGFNAINL
jgi:hydroxyacylglutathione hydrolase